MNPRLLSAIAIAAVVLCGRDGRAQQPDSVARRQQRTLDSLTAVLRAVQARLDSVTGARRDTSAGDELAAIRAAAAMSVDSAGAAPPQQAKLGQNALNPEISVTGDLRAQSVSSAPHDDTFTAREFEVGFQSALDPYSTAKVFLAAEDGEISIEEGYAYFTALPLHLRLDVGRFRQTIGELNRWHLHALNTGDYPLVIRRFAGEEGILASGASLYWPMPSFGVPGTYELTVQATTGSNAVLFAGGRRPSLGAQLSGFWQMSRSTFAQASVSGLHGTNPDTALTTDLAVAAARFSWRPPREALSREFNLRGELWSLHRRFDLPGAARFSATRLGGYVDASWRLDRRWIAGVRGDYVESPDPGPLAHEWAVTPTLTYWQSEFVYVRGQYERSRSLLDTTSHRFTLQLVFAMGPHKHELF
jgi:hypothetical protein